MKKYISPILFLAALMILSQRSFAQNPMGLTDRFLIVLDVQQYWTDQIQPAAARDSFISALNMLIRNTDSSRVVYVRSPLVAKTLSLSGKGFRVDSVMAPAFDSKLLVVGQNFFTKTTGDAFAEADLTAFLKNRGAREVVVAGLVAEGCITKTTEGGIAKGFSILLCPDAIAGKSEKGKQKALRRLTAKGALLMPAIANE
jgi:nicotinamidase-related amidase